MIIAYELRKIMKNIFLLTVIGQMIISMAR